MARVIWKFQLHPQEAVSMPAGARILVAREQGDSICLWAEVDPEAPSERRSFDVYGTGNALSAEPGRYLGTALLEGGRFVFHVYDPVG
jgi:hypothetical protein